MQGWETRALLGLLGAVVLVVSRTCARVEVSGTSMVPTLLPGDRLLVWRPGAIRVQAGDVVVAPDPRQPSRPLVKRVVAVRGGRLDLAGDNPAASTDSRSFGEIPAASVVGRAVYRYAPPQRAGPL